MEIKDEEWIDIIGYDGIYQVSNLGRVKSLSRWIQLTSEKGYLSKEKILKPCISNKFASIRVFLSNNGITKPFSVSRLVFFSFNYNIKNLPDYFVIHKDNDFKNNCLNNLKIGTQNEIGNITFASGKMNHLKLGNPKSNRCKK